MSLAKKLILFFSAICLLFGGFLALNFSKLQNALIAYEESGDFGVALEVFNRAKAPLRKLLSELSPLECDVNFSPCKMQNSNLVLEISPQPIYVLAEEKLKISGEELKNIKNPVIKAEGLNMFMGLLVDDFARTSQSEISADVVFSACTKKSMRYRLWLLDGSKETGIYLDIDIRR